MFNFNVWNPPTCNDIPDCGQNCHDLNPCYSNITYLDTSGNSHHLFSTFDQDWNLTCISGISCGQEVYDLPPKYYRHYSPCCWDVNITGGSGTGLCNQSCEISSNYTTINPGFIVEVESGNLSANVYVRHNFYGQGTGGCGTPTGLYPFYSGEALIGTINNLDCGLDGRSGLSFAISGFQNNNVLSLCNYDDVVINYDAKYTQQDCQKYWTGQGAGIHSIFGFGFINGLNLIDCIPVEDIIISGWPGCYTQDGDFIETGDPFTNNYTISLKESIGWQVTKFELSGVVGYDDDLPIASAVKTSCTECQDLNRVWLPGDWNGSAPYSPKAICCNCPETDMCINFWTLDIGHPSGYLILNSQSYGEIARWSKDIPYISGNCPVEISGGPHNWSFDFLSMATPGSGDLPIESGFWNRCDFTNSSIDLEYDTDLVDFDQPPSGVDCNTVVDLPNGYCHDCGDRNGPDEFLVTVNLNLKSRPVYTGLWARGVDTNPTFYNIPGNLTVPYDPPLYENDPPCLPNTEKFQEEINYLGTILNGIAWDTLSEIVNLAFIDQGCTLFSPLGVCHDYATSLVSPVCTAEVMNGAFVVTKHSECINDYTIRWSGGVCPCYPCDSGVLPINSCTWRVEPNTCGLPDPDVWFNNPARTVNISGLCPCVLGPCDAGNCVNEDIIDHCAGCQEKAYTKCNDHRYPLTDPNLTVDDVLSSYRDTKACLCCYSGPVLSIAKEDVSGVLKLRLSVTLDGSTWEGITLGCDVGVSELIDIPTDSVFGGYDCSGSPYFVDAIDCSSPIDHTFTIPPTAVYFEDPHNSGTYYTFECYDGGTIRVESL